ncbi:MAG: cytochrome b/b6 domain-containing protein [Limisphaerales bacterium]
MKPPPSIAAAATFAAATAAAFLGIVLAFAPSPSVDAAEDTRAPAATPAETGPTATPAAAVAEEEVVPNDKCLECHNQNDLTRTDADGRVFSLFVDEARFRASVHQTNLCVDCHQDLRFRWEHPDDGHVAQPVQCAACHAAQSETFDASAHGIALRNGSPTAATCKDCHGHHEVPRLGDPDSPVNTARLVETCAQCHPEAASDLAESSHGTAAIRGRREAPNCIDCHAEHQIESLKGASPLRISQDICGKCHASERLNTRFRLPRHQVDTFFESYHGLAAQGRSTKAANCASCHGSHKILPSTNPASSIHKDNLITTCGQCHPGIGTKFASGKVHFDDSSDSEVGLIVNRWVRRLYLVLIVGTCGVLAAHNGLIFLRKIRATLRSRERNVVRMDVHQRRQHLLLLTSFILLAVTGFALRFPDSWLSWALGTEDIRRWLHRIAGVVLLGTGAWHLGYLALTTEGRRLFRDLLPRRQDWTDVQTNARYLAGRSANRARFGRFGYPEKFEYWAVVWGTIIMGVTGLMIWLKVDVTLWLPRWLIDVATTIHYYEAILACLAILIWHFYHVFFDPDVYPGNFAWLDGKVTQTWQAHEHPLETVPPSPSPAEPSPAPDPPHPSH